MMKVEEIQAWLFHVEPLSGVSLSHYIGQFRRSNNLTLAALGKEAGFGGAVISRWEQLSRRKRRLMDERNFAGCVGFHSSTQLQILAVS